jgi:putative chitinase
MLGNKQAGDGAKYHGRGYIQLTGRDNYRRAGQALGLPLEAQPELVERPDVAAKVAVWFWQNQVAPRVTNFSDTAQVTKPINSGLRGLEDRQAKYASIMALMQPRG